MAYRRRQGLGRSNTFKEEMYKPPVYEDAAPSYSKSSPRAAVRASDSAHSRVLSAGEGPTYDYTSMGSSNEPGSFWGVLARKAKAILDEDNGTPQFSPKASPLSQMSKSHDKVEISRKMDSPGRSNGNTFNAEGHYTKTPESSKLQIMRKGINIEDQNLGSSKQHSRQTSQDQLKATRDVAMATATQAKVLLRELKTVKEDLTFSKQRCSQLEEENKMLREGREKGLNPDDDDMIRVQLETLLAEKARLAHENAMYARENLFLREIVEYHQLTMQDVVYLDEGDEEIDEDDEAYNSPTVDERLSVSSHSPRSPHSNSVPVEAAPSIPNTSSQDSTTS